MTTRMPPLTDLSEEKVSLSDYSLKVMNDQNRFGGIMLSVIITWCSNSMIFERLCTGLAYITTLFLCNHIFIGSSSADEESEYAAELPCFYPP